MRWSAGQRLIIIVVLVSLTTVLLGKLLLLATSPNLFLYIYGVLVTLVTFVTFAAVIWQYYDPYDLAVQQPVPQDWPLVSIILAAYNEGPFIEQCLQSVLQQDYEPKEIFVVNDCSTDDTSQILDKYADIPGVSIIHLTRNVGKKRAIAVAVARSRGQILAFTDSDTVLEPEAIGKTVRILEAFPDIGAISGHVRALNARDNVITLAQDSWYEGQFAIRKAFESIYGAVSCVSGPLAVFRRAAIYNYIPAWIEDSFLNREFRFSTDRSLTNFVLTAGSRGEYLKKKYSNSPFVKNENYPSHDWYVTYTRAARALTLVPNTFSRLVKQQIRWKKSFIRSVFLLGRYYYKKPLPVALGYYFHILFVVASPIVAARHLIYLPLRGSPESAFLYLAGICYVGFIFGLGARLIDSNHHSWFYRPIMSLLSTLVFSWLLLYSALTIKNPVWHRS